MSVWQIISIFNFSGFVLLDSVKNVNICFDCDSFRSYYSLPCFGSAGESECKFKFLFRCYNQRPQHHCPRSYVIHACKN